MRVVSLVPSATETLLALGVTPVACTRFCEQPGIRTVGGTKNPDLEAIIGLAPDLVIVNDEENRREDADALVAAGLELHSMSPRSVADVEPAIAAIAGAIGAAVPAAQGAPADAEPVARRRCVVFVWRRPWMVLTADTYAASLLSVLGCDQIALGLDGNDRPDENRYPEVDLGAVAVATPALVLLPDEPYAFTERRRAEVADAIPSADVILVDGRDLFWWGVRTPAALERLRACLA